ncbi:MAG: DUF2231 domain-containing protein [Bacteroidota bacterium]
MFSTSHLHPMLVHFPIALVAFGFFAYFLSVFFKKHTYLASTAFSLLIFGTLTALVALVSGFLFTSEMSGEAGIVRETHELAAIITTSLLVITSILSIYIKTQQKEKMSLKWAIFILYCLAALSVSLTGFFGGSLVYNFMMPL